MTRKHFQMFAEYIRDKCMNEHAVVECIDMVCTVGKRINPAFNRSKFIEACGYSEEELESYS